MKAGIYVRISSDPTGQAAGVTRQEEDCADLAAKLGWDVAEVYRENDTSAVSKKGRPLFKQMLADLETGHIGAIVAWHPDRLYRRAVDLLPLVDVCKTTNAQIATVTAGDLDLSTPSGRMLAGILAQIATYEGEHKSERWKRSVTQKRKAGVFAPSGKRLYGYDSFGNVMEEEAAVTQWVFKEILAGASVTGLCGKLTERGCLTTQGNPWRPTNLKAYLLNPRLAGWATIGKEIIGDGQHEPIVDRETWEQTKALLSAHMRIGPRTRKALLPGLLFCGTCGEELRTGQRPGPPKTRTYRCYKRVGDPNCGKVSIDAEPVEQIVETYVRTLLDDPRLWERLASIRNTAGASELATEATALEARALEIEGALEHPGALPVKVLERQYANVTTRLAEIRGQLADLRPVTVPASGGEWPDDLQQRRRLVDLVVARVDVDPMPPEIRGRFVPERVRITDA